MFRFLREDLLLDRLSTPVWVIGRTLLGLLFAYGFWNWEDGTIRPDYGDFGVFVWCAMIYMSFQVWVSIRTHKSRVAKLMAQKGMPEDEAKAYRAGFDDAMESFAKGDLAKTRINNVFDFGVAAHVRATADAYEKYGDEIGSDDDSVSDRACEKAQAEIDEMLEVKKAWVLQELLK